jgi:hypothetical protein
MVVAPDSFALLRSVRLDGVGGVYVVGGAESYAVQSSHDSGASWTTTQLADSRARLFAVAVADRSTLYAVGDAHAVADVSLEQPFVAKSTDGGATLGLTYPSFAGGLYDVAVDAGGNVLAVGGAGDGGFFVRSTDGGASWTRTVVPGTIYLNAIWVSPDGGIYACGAGRTPSSSADGGDGGDDGGDGASDAAAAPIGVLFRSNDGGASWAEVVAAPGALSAVSGTTDGARVTAVGVGYTQVESRDHGATWTLVSGTAAAAAARQGPLTGVWVPDATSSPYLAMNSEGSVFRYVSTGDRPGDLIVTEGEALPTPALGPQSGAIAVTGSATDGVWAVGFGIFHRK